jgi:hypothetical protein
MADRERLSTEETALAGLGSALGQREASDQRWAMRRAADDQLLRDLLEDSRRGAAAERYQMSKVIPVGAGVVQGGNDGVVNRSGWVEPRSLETKEWAYMSEAERAQRDEEWRKEFAARRAAEAKAK